MKQTKDHITPGDIYIYNEDKITISTDFIYEVDLYRISKNRANVIRTRFYKSNKILNVKSVEIVRYFSSFTIERYITLVSAPLSFIKENKLSKYEKRKSRVSSSRVSKHKP